MSTREDEDLSVDEEVLADEVVEEEEVADTEEESVEESDDSEESESEDDPDEDDEEEDRIVSIGDEPEESEDSEEGESGGQPNKLVKKLRKVARGYEKEIKQLRKQLEAKDTVEEKPVELGEKPTLKSCGYNQETWETELEAYHERKRAVEAQQQQKQAAQQKQAERWQSRVDNYVQGKKTHAFKDMVDVEQTVEETLSLTQQKIIVQGADDPALLVYAIGKRPKLLEELSKIEDPVEFAFKIAKVETQVKVKDRKPPAPEKKVSSGKSGGAKGSEARLEQLRAEAEKTGDYTKVMAYKKKLREQKG